MTCDYSGCARNGKSGFDVIGGEARAPEVGQPYIRFRDASVEVHSDFERLIEPA